MLREATRADGEGEGDEEAEGEEGAVGEGEPAAGVGGG